MLALGLVPACRSPLSHVESADRQVYALLEARRDGFAARPAEFTIDPAAQSLRSRLLESPDAAEPVRMSLVEAMQVASENSRDYQRRKELLYLAALDLTFERWRFTVIEGGQLAGFLDGQGDQAESAEFDAGFSLTRLLGSGALIVGDIGLNLFRSLSTGDGFDPVSSVGLSITQPLMRGFGKRIAQEPLTQAERTLVYEVRNFERFRRTFAVDVESRYLRLLQQTDIIANQRANYENLTLLREFNEARAEAGRQTEIQVDQARNNELSSRDGLLRAEQDLQGQLDDFKFFLGLPPQARIELDQGLFARLKESRPEPLDLMDADELADFALQARLDHLTALDRFVDAERKAMVSADALRSAVDFAAGADVSSDPGSPGSLDFDDVNWSASLQVDLALNRLPQRNAYRTAVINVQVAKRGKEASEDGIRVDLRDEVREATRTLQSWNLQRNAVALNERRVESTALSLQAGRAQTRDILESEADLLSARNSLTRALIDYRLAILTLWRDLEVLRVDEEGLNPDEELLALLRNTLEP